VIQYRITSLFKVLPQSCIIVIYFMGSALFFSGCINFISMTLTVFWSRICYIFYFCFSEFCCTC